jgi:hypothetical protein
VKSVVVVTSGVVVVVVVVVVLAALAVVATATGIMPRAATLALIPSTTERLKCISIT